MAMSVVPDPAVPYRDTHQNSRVDGGVRSSAPSTSVYPVVAFCNIAIIINKFHFFKQCEWKRQYHNYLHAGTFCKC